MTALQTNFVQKPTDSLSRLNYSYNKAKNNPRKLGYEYNHMRVGINTGIWELKTEKLNVYK